jgi:hypothetical protein
LIKSQAEQKA